MLREDAGILDDLIVYFLTESWFRMVVNAGTRDKDLAWIRRHAAALGVEVTERKDLAMIAVQGPNAREKAAQAIPAEHRSTALALDAFFGARMWRAVRRTDRLHRRRRLGGDGSRRAARASCGIRGMRQVSGLVDSARVTLCGSKPA